MHGQTAEVGVPTSLGPAGALPKSSITNRSATAITPRTIKTVTDGERGA
jgi:hypothetical protein